MAPGTNNNQMVLIEDYLIIAGMYRKKDANQGTNNNPELYVLSSYYCGAGIGRDSNDNTNTPDGTDDGTGVKADNVLFTIVFNSDKFPGNRPDTNNNNQNNAENELGFSLDYRVSTSCADVTLSDMATG